MEKKVETTSKNDEKKARTKIARIIDHKTRHTLDKESIQKAVETLDVSKYMRIVILPSAEWAENKLNILHNNHTDSKGISHNRTFKIVSNLTSNKVKLGDRDNDVSCSFDKSKPFISLLEGVCEVTKPDEAPYSFTERFLLVYAPNVNGPDTCE